MSGLIPGLSADCVVTVNRVLLRREYTIDDLEERVAMLCENGNEEIAYRMPWSGKAYSPEEAVAARAAKERYASVA